MMKFFKIIFNPNFPFKKNSIMHLFYVYGNCVSTSEESTESRGTAVINGCEFPHGCWQLNSAPLKEQRS